MFYNFIFSNINFFKVSNCLQNVQIKGGKGLGKGGAKRHRKGARYNIQGITKPVIRRLARCGGVKRIPGMNYKEISKAPHGNIQGITSGGINEIWPNDSNFAMDNDWDSFAANLRIDETEEQIDSDHDANMAFIDDIGATVELVCAASDIDDENISSTFTATSTASKRAKNTAKQQRKRANKRTKPKPLAVQIEEGNPDSRIAPDEHGRYLISKVHAVYDGRGSRNEYNPKTAKTWSKLISSRNSLQLKQCLT
ncbi:hypothetical protein niasHT_028596 [Heterodera trifolii]|uniref:Histone H4 n=1 Tax=Heterodera trifolii TaxID=157864 RepID=A0ABD2KAS7_9BILA